MPFKAYMKIDDLIGKTVQRKGLCVAEDEYGVAVRCSMAPHEGILKKINYKNKTEEIDSIVMEIGSWSPELSFNPDPESKTCEKEIYLYHDDKLVYESWGEDSERANRPDDKKP